MFIRGSRKLTYSGVLVGVFVFVAVGVGVRVGDVPAFCNFAIFISGVGAPWGISASTGAWGDAGGFSAGI